LGSPISYTPAYILVRIVGIRSNPYINFRDIFTIDRDFYHTTKIRKYSEIVMKKTGFCLRVGKKTSEFKIKAISKLPRYYQDDC
jgi:hypothetical protein